MPSPPSRRCSECGKSLADRGPRARTCGDLCRAERSRRQRRRNAEAAEEAARGMPEHQRVVTEIVRSELPDVAHEVMKEELRPVVREALTEDALRGIRDLLNLTGSAVAALAEDLQGDDPVLRQRAASLVVKYTMGNPALVRPVEDGAGAQMVVNFTLPRPSDAPDEAPGEADVIDETWRTCDQCSKEAPPGEFVEDSTRCLACHEALRATVLGRVGGEG